MAFFLLGRVDDTLRLLCPDTFSSRQDAMAALSSVTAEPGFDLWDAEVLLLDTDSGTPVLLMRPQASAQEPAVKLDEELEVVVVDELDEEPLESVVTDEVIEAEDEPEGEATAPGEPESDAVSDEATGDEEPFIVAEDEPAPEIVSEPEAEVVLEDDSEGAAEPLVAVEDAAVADAITEEFEAEEDAAGALKAALSRTAAQMEAEGIVAPESIAAATIEPESEQPSEPEVEQEAETEATAELEATPGPAAEQEWPWDVAAEAEPAVSPDIAFVINDLEEPSLDDGSILRGSIDDETFAAARPVIMGSYSEPREDASLTELIEDAPPVEPMGLADIQPPVAPLPSPSGFAVPVVGDAGDIFPLDALVDTTDPIDAIPEAPAAAANADDRDISDFILDLGDAPAAETAVPSADAGGLDEYTCADCVYEETCPNKDQRLPKDCGSFQWR